MMIKKILATILFSLLPLTAFASTVGWTRTGTNLTPLYTNDTVTLNILSGYGTRCLQVDNTGLLAVAGAACGSGGGSGGGTWSTTTSSVPGWLLNYSNNNTDIITIGGTSTSTAKFIFDPNISRGLIPYASTTALTVSGQANIGSLVLSNVLGLLYGGTGLTGVGASSTVMQSNGSANVYQKLSVGNFTSPNVSQWTNDSGYITGNQTITLSGDVTGSGSTAITTTYNNAVPVNKGGTGLTATGASSTVLTTNGVNSVFQKLSVGQFTSPNISQWTNDAGYLTGMAFGYPFPLAGNATSTLTQFNGGLTAYASSTIGNGTRAGGLTVSGDATTTNDINVGRAVNFNTAIASTPTATGSMYWDATERAVSVNLGNTVVLQIGQESYIRVRNNTGATIPNGSAVYFSGALGNRPTVALAIASDLTKSSVAGLATEDIANNTDGFITIHGIVHGLDTSAYAESTDLYLSATSSGAVTSAIPAYPNAVSFIGQVTVSNPGNGAISVELDPHHTTLSASNLRVLQSVVTGNGVSIGTSSPYARLSVIGQYGSTTPLFDIASTTNALYATSSVFTVLGNGNVGIGTTSPSMQFAVQGNGLISGNISTAGLTATGTVTFTGMSTGCLQSTSGVISSTGTACGSAVGGSGTVSTSSVPTVGNLAYWTSNGYPSLLGTVATGTISASGGITATANQYVIGSGLTIGCTTASASAAGCLGTADFSRFNSATTTAGTGLTYSGGAFNVNTSQNIATLSNLTTNGFVKTSGSNGTLSIDTNTYLTSLAGAASSTILADNNTFTGANNFNSNTAQIIKYASSTVTSATKGYFSNTLQIATTTGTDTLTVGGSGQFTGWTNPTTGIGLELGYLAGSGDIVALNRYNSTYLPILYEALDHHWTLSGTEGMTFNTTGLGIGSTTPRQSLSVQGNALVSGNLSVANLTATGTLTLTGLTGTQCLHEVNGVVSGTGSDCGVGGGGASTTLLADNNAFSGLNKFTNVGSTTFSGGIDAARICITGTTNCLGSSSGSTALTDYYAATTTYLNAPSNFIPVATTTSINAGQTIKIEARCVPNSNVTNGVFGLAVTNPGGGTTTIDQQIYNGGNAAQITETLIGLYTATTSGPLFIAINDAAGVTLGTAAAVGCYSYGIAYHRFTPNQVVGGGGSSTGASTTLLADNNTFSGINQFTNSATTTHAGAISVGGAPTDDMLSVKGVSTSNLFEAYDSASNSDFIITNLGRVGISTTTPWGLLSVNPTALGSGIPEFVVGSSTATDFVVASNGNVGIGTSNPGAYKLNVQGGQLMVSSHINTGGSLLATGWLTANSLSTSTIKGTLMLGTTTDGYNPTQAGVLTIDTYANPATRYTENAIDISGNLNDFLEVNIMNKSTGTNAQSGFSATSDVGTLTSGFMFCGINNSKFWNPQAYNVGGPGDVNCLGLGNDMFIANGTPGKKIHFLNGGTSTSTNEAMTIDGTNGLFVGIGTSSPYAALSVVGASGIVADHIVATSTATSTFGGPVIVGAPTATIRASCIEMYYHTGANSFATSSVYFNTAGVMVSEAGACKTDGVSTTTLKLGGSIND